MRPSRPGRRISIAVFVVFVALSSAWVSQWDGRADTGSPAEAAESTDKAAVPDRQAPPQKTPGAPNAGRKADFDFYLLALTSHPAFCADGHQRKPECRAASPPISIHGLWPERREPGRYPRDCEGPPLDLEKDLERRLATLMPGMADGLHDHEWRKHGTCTGIDDDVYFGLLYTLASRVDRALGHSLTTLAGGRTSAAALREQAEARAPGMGATLTFHCRTVRGAPADHRREPYLVEIRQCIAADARAGGAPGAPLSCASVGRRDQGCGAGFRIAP